MTIICGCLKELLLKDLDDKWSMVTFGGGEVGKKDGKQSVKIREVKHQFFFVLFFYFRPYI